jgi:SSS family solute:Na+ symporter
MGRDDSKARRWQQFTVAAGKPCNLFRFGGLFHYLQTALAFLASPVAALSMIGLFRRGASATAAFLTPVGGHMVSSVFFTLSVTDIFLPHFAVVAGLLLLTG